MVRPYSHDQREQAAATVAAMRNCHGVASLDKIGECGAVRAAATHAPVRDNVDERPSH